MLTAHLCLANIDISIQHLCNFCINKKNGNQQGRLKVAPRERLRFNPVDYEIWGWLQERVYRSRVHDVNHLMERLMEGGVVLLGSQHHLCGSESVAYSSASLRKC